MDIKKWAGSRLGMASASDMPGGGVAAPPAGGMMGMYGMHGPGGAPLFNAIKSSDLPPTMGQWAQAGGTAPEHPQGAPAWAANHEAFENATGLVKKHWDQYEEPWAVVAYAYDLLKDVGGAKPAAPGAPPGPPKPPGPPGGAPPGPPKPPGPPGPPKPPGMP